jgi:peptide-methionine (S)-S-oxide reductase
MKKINHKKPISKKIETAIFGSGCFWCTEAIFSRLKGVIKVTSGYAGGRQAKPSYQQVSSGKTGHAEVVKIEYDPTVISFKDLLAVFFSTHDPTTLNRQGNDLGEQYRSIILYQDERQKMTAEGFIKKLTEEKNFDRPMVTEIKPLSEFYPAESYHQHYYEKHKSQPYCQVMISNKLAKFRKSELKDLMKK